MATIVENKRHWGEHYHWPRHGNEWGDQKNDWGQTLTRNFISSNITSQSTVLEIAPGHGRWTKALIGKARKIILVDLNENCIKYCKQRFSDSSNIDYFVNDGKSLNFIIDESVDFIWSYDAFVHMDADVYDCYFSEFSRILKPGKKANIHHPGRADLFLAFSIMNRLGKYGKYAYRAISLRKLSREYGDGGRSNISKEIVRNIAERAPLKLS